LALAALVLQAVLITATKAVSLIFNQTAATRVQVAQVAQVAQGPQRTVQTAATRLRLVVLVQRTTLQEHRLLVAVAVVALVAVQRVLVAAVQAAVLAVLAAMQQPTLVAVAVVQMTV
jgi:hypothetical protein